MASSENTQAASPFGRRWLISGAVVLLALALAVFLAVRGGVDKQPADTAATASSAPSAGVASQNTDNTTPGRCSPAKSGEHGVPAEPPAVGWERHPSGAVVPVSGEAGPRSRGDKAWRCFDHSSTGALLAGMNVIYNFSTGDKNSASDTPKRDELFKRGQLPPTAEFGTVEGYRFLLTTDREAEVEYLLSTKGKWGVMRVPMTWSDELQDWLLDSNATSMGASIIESPTGFTMWR